MKLRTAGLAVFVIALIFLAGCGDSGSGDSRPTADPEQPVSTRTPETIRALTTADDLIQALLSIDDMPVGWEGNQIEVSESNQTSFCGEDFETTRLRFVEISFEQTSTGPFISHQLQTYSTGEGRKSFDAGAERAKACREFEVNDEDGGITVFTMTSLSFPRIADDTFAFRVTSEGGLFGPITADAVGVLRGDVINLVVHAVSGSGAPDSTLTERIVRLADQKLEDAMRTE